MVEKQYGEQYVRPAAKFIERIDAKVAEVMGYRDETEVDEGNKYAHAVKKPYKLGNDKGCKPGFVLDSKTRMCMPKAPKGMSQAQFNNESDDIRRLAGLI